MKEVENELDRANKSSKDNLDKKDRLLSITSDPLSEMVWSQSKGLSVQCVASSLTEKKSSVLWNAESFNIVISSPQCSNRGKGIIHEKSNSASTDEQSSETCANLKLSNRTEPISTTNEAGKITIAFDTLSPGLNDQDPTHLLTKLATPSNASSCSKPVKHTQLKVHDSSLKHSNKLSKGKEHVKYDSEEDRESVSKEAEDSQDSIESCNSRRLSSETRKQARSSEFKVCRENKRLKKHIYNGSESSFRNWVSTITHGFSRFTKATPLSVAPPLSSEIEGNLNYYSLSKDDENDTGFKSIFKSLYLPNLDTKKVNANKLQVVGNEVSIPIEGVQNNSSTNLASNNQNDFLHNTWITRFSSKVSYTVEKSANDMQGVDLMSSKDQDWLKTRNMKCETSNVNSPFGKGLDDWQISTKSSKVSGNVSLTLTTCLLCGKRSHGMRACS